MIHNITACVSDVRSFKILASSLFRCDSVSRTYPVAYNRHDPHITDNRHESWRDPRYNHIYVSDVRYLTILDSGLFNLPCNVLYKRLEPYVWMCVVQRRCGQRWGRRYLKGGVCQECDEQQVHSQHAQRLRRRPCCPTSELGVDKTEDSIFRTHHQILRWLRFSCSSVLNQIATLEIHHQFYQNSHFSPLS